jgi:hypothetical protein
MTNVPFPLGLVVVCSMSSTGAEAQLVVGRSGALVGVEDPEPKFGGTGERGENFQMLHHVA